MPSLLSFPTPLLECGVEPPFYLAHDKPRISISQKYGLRSDFILFPSTTTKSWSIKQLPDGANHYKKDSNYQVLFSDPFVLML